MLYGPEGGGSALSKLTICFGDFLSFLCLNALTFFWGGNAKVTENGGD